MTVSFPTVSATRPAGGPLCRGDSGFRCGSAPNLEVVALHCSSGAWLVQVRGEVDLATADRLAGGQHWALSTSPPNSTVAPPVVRVDLSRVSFLGCAGLTALLHAAQHAADRGGQLRVSAAPAPIRRVLDLAGLGPHLTAAPPPRVSRPVTHARGT